MVQSFGPYLNDVNLIFSTPFLSVKNSYESIFLLIFVNVAPVAPVYGPYVLITPGPSICSLVLIMLSIIFDTALFHKNFIAV